MNSKLSRKSLASIADAGVNLFCELNMDNHTGELDFGVQDAIIDMIDRLKEVGLWDKNKEPGDNGYIGPAVIE